MSSVFEEIRKNKQGAAEIRRADRVAAREQDRADRAQRAEQCGTRARVRRERVAAAAHWVGTHPVELLLSMIVVVPGLLAWSAMSAYGSEIYGPLGWGLPLFSEAAMWAFAFAVHAARQAGRPRGWLLVGLWVFTSVSGALNLIHGLAMDGGGLGTGLVMALVAIGGPIAHQLITAAPLRTRRTRAQRRTARIARIAERRAARMERAAARQAVGHLDAEGRVRLVHSTGTVTLASRSLWRPRRRLVPEVVPGVPVTPLRDLSAELRALLPRTTGEPAGTAETGPAAPAAGTADEITDAVAEVRRAIAAGELTAKPSRRRVQVHLGVRASTAQAVLRSLREVAA